MSEDPKLFDAGDYNLFRYCHNDPLDLTDPMGLGGEATGLLQGGTHDRVWDMTHWFDRSNLGQGNFQGFTLAMTSQSDRDAKGPTTGQTGMPVERAIPVNGRRDPLLDGRTESKLATLVEPVRDMARSLLYHARVDLHLDVRVIDGTRTYAEQNALYAQGRTAPGPIVTKARGGESFHNFGVAFDVGIFRGRTYIEGGTGYTSVGHLGERTGLEWGGRWRFQDNPHFQYPGLRLDVSRARFEQGLSAIPGY
jgi:hypothetical protein